MQRVAIYARTSTDKNQTVENQLLQLNEVAARLGWTIVCVLTDEGISGTKGRDRHPAFDALIRAMLATGTDIRETARHTKAGTANVLRTKHTMLEANAA